MKITTLFLTLYLIISSLAPESSSATSNKENKLRQTIVKIHAVSLNYDFFSPWRSGFQVSSTGSGVVIKDKRILTNAHVVSNQKFLEVQAYGESKRYIAKVLFVSHEADLAILYVEDDAFFDGRGYLNIGNLPESLEDVLVYGYPAGGDSLSITKGILSRIEYRKYVHSGYRFIAGQVDAAINPGNSGGPVIVNGKVSGIVMQGLNGEGIDNIGYMIPPQMIKHFLEDVKDGKYNGFPILGVKTQRLNNASMRKYYNMGDEQSGVVLTNVYWNSPARKVLEKGDIILTISGVNVGNDSTVEFRKNERISFASVLDGRQIDDEIEIIILRDGRKKKVNIKLSLNKGAGELVPLLKYDAPGEYFIYGGAVFTPLTSNFICGWEKCNSYANFLIELERGSVSKNRREIVLLTEVLNSEVSRGYQDISYLKVDKINNKRYVDFNDFVETVSNSKDKFIVFEMYTGEQIVLDNEKVLKANAAILDTYNVSSDRFVNSVK